MRATDPGKSAWATRALFTFLAGFSEPFFLGLVQRVAVVPDKDATLDLVRGNAAIEQAALKAA